MDHLESIRAAAMLLAGIAVLSLVELLVPLRKRTKWSSAHLIPNILLTLITFALAIMMNGVLLSGLIAMQTLGWGLFNVLNLPAWIEIAGAILALDLAWYVTHRSMHASQTLWRIHVTHHSDPMVDVTTTVRQHPLEGAWRYFFLTLFGLGFGVSPVGFAIYRVWSAFHGQIEHANIKLPQWLDSTITLLFSSPNLHKIHHSRDRRFTDTNYGNIFSIWDRMFASFTPSEHGVNIDYGLDGYDNPRDQSLAGMLGHPFAEPKTLPTAADGPLPN